MPTFKAYLEFEKYINIRIKQAMSSIGKQVMVELQDYVFENWYKAMGNPKDYNRTFEFLNSATFDVNVINKKLCVEVYFDPDKIKPAYDEFSLFNQHMSMGQSPTNEYLVDWIEYGQNSPIYSYNGIGMIEATKDWCRANYKKLLSRELARYEIKIK